MDIVKDVKAFHEMCDQPILEAPKIPSLERSTLRHRLISEETVRELLPALERGDIEQVADGICDSIYVLVGTALEYGLPLEALWKEVQRSNLAKGVRAAGTGKLTVIRDAGGKILKPPGWSPPDIRGVLIAHGWKLPEDPSKKVTAREIKR